MRRFATLVQVIREGFQAAAKRDLMRQLVERCFQSGGVFNVGGGEEA